MINTGLQAALEAQANDPQWQDDLESLAASLRDADNRLYGQALAAGIVVPVKHAEKTHPVAASGARVGYETARDLAYDAARIAVVGSIVQFGFVEVTPLMALVLMVVLASLLRLVIAHVGEA